MSTMTRYDNKSERQGGPLEPSPWLPDFPEHTEGRVRLFCFPFAGGTGEYYRSWKAELGEFVCLCPIELPGRGSRTDEPFASSLTSAAQEIGSAILSRVDEPFAFFGHSLGAALALETAFAMRRLGGSLPQVFLASGTPPPHTGFIRPPDPDAPEQTLREIIRSFGGTPAGILEDPALAAYFFPIFRSDFRLAAEYEPRPPEPLDMAITVLSGDKDPDAPEEALRRWENLSLYPCHLRMFSGGHFFLEEQRQTVLQAVGGALSVLAAEAPLLKRGPKRTGAEACSPTPIESGD